MSPKQLFSFNGRMRRKHFVVACLLGFVLFVLLLLAWYITRIDAILYFRLLMIAAFVPLIVRRLHDMGYAGGLAIGVLLFPLVILLLLLLPGTPNANAYGPNPKSPAT